MIKRTSLRCDEKGSSWHSGQWDVDLTDDVLRSGLKSHLERWLAFAYEVQHHVRNASRLSHPMCLWVHIALSSLWSRAKYKLLGSHATYYLKLELSREDRQNEVNACINYRFWQRQGLKTDYPWHWRDLIPFYPHRKTALLIIYHRWWDVGSHPYNNDPFLGGLVWWTCLQPQFII